MPEKFKITVSGIDLTVTNPQQIMNMGGPYLCTLYKGDKFISHDCIASNFIFSDNSDKLFFVKNHLIKEKMFFTRKYIRFFTINYYSFNENLVFEFARRFDILYIKKLKTPEELEIYHAFHDQNPKQKEIFYLNKEPLNASIIPEE